MSNDVLLPSGDDNGWPTNNWDDTNNTIAAASGTALETTTDNDVVVIDLTDTVVVDADTVNSVTVRIRCKDTSAGTKNSLIVDLFIGGAGQGPVTSAVLVSSYETRTYNDIINWDQDWTAAQLNGMQLEITANQTGKGESATWHIDEIEVDVDYTLASTGNPKGPLGLPLQGALGGPIG